MLQPIRQLFRKIRIVINALRTGIVGFALVCAGWIFLAPPSQIERAVMDLSAEASASDVTLRAHRMAKILSMIRYDGFYDFVAAQADLGLTGEEIRDNVDTAALGIFPVVEGPSGADAIQKAFVSNSGAKFVPARTN